MNVIVKPAYSRPFLKNETGASPDFNDGFWLFMSYLCHTEDEIPFLIRLLVDNKETRTFPVTEFKDLTDK